MAKKTSTVKTPATRTNRALPTMERVDLLCPTDGQAEKIAQTFGLPEADFDSISQTVFDSFKEIASSITDHMNARAMDMLMQRLAGSYVSAAIGAGSFYGSKVSEARQATSNLSNDERDDDRGGAAGFDSRGERARKFAADVAMQAFALRAAAHGAVNAYAEITGNTWKPYDSNADAAPAISRRAASEELNAFSAE